MIIADDWVFKGDGIDILARLLKVWAWITFASFGLTLFFVMAFFAGLFLSWVDLTALGFAVFLLSVRFFALFTAILDVLAVLKSVIELIVGIDS